MPTYNENLLPSSTGFDLGNSTQRWDAFVQTLDVLGIAITSFESIRFADQFVGGSVTAQIDAALADTGAKIVLVPSAMGAGAPSSIGPGQLVVDLRSGFKIFNHSSASVAAFSLDDTGPSLATINNGGILTLPTGTRTLVARDTTDTLTNKTLAGPVADLMTLTEPTGTAPLMVTSTTPVMNLTCLPTVYNASGVQQVGAKVVVGATTLVAGAATVTLTDAAVFPGTYVIAGVDNTAAAAVRFAAVDGSHFTIAGTATDVITWIAVG